MTQFLADYGLKWKGMDSGSEEEEEGKQREGHFNFNQLDKEMNFKKP